jgi:hypothetical protein
MRLKKLVPMVGFCAVSFLSSSAMAELWAVNCAKQQCLDATTGNINGMVQVSDCTKSKKAQGWDAHALDQASPILNAYDAYEGFGKPCLDIYVKGDPTQNRVVTNRCNSLLQAQLWNFALNGQVGPIDNYYTQQCLTVANDSTVTATECNGDPSQRWKWVNVGDINHLSCSNGKKSVEVEAKCLLKAVIPPEGGGACTLNPLYQCVKTLNKCGHSTSCTCPHGYDYNQATGQCDWGLLGGSCGSETGATTKGKKPSRIKQPTVSQCTSRPILCTKDINECGNPSKCYCEDGHTYNSATGACDLDFNSILTWPAGLPVYKHIVIVVEENKSYNEIIGNPNAPYINKLKQDGANFTQMFAEEHGSQGNYFWMFSGNNQNVGFTDQVPSKKNHPNYPFKTANLGEQLINAGLSFKGYAESMPCIGFTGDTACQTDTQGNQQCLYARKHVPWISFANVPRSSKLPFTDFPTKNFDNLPTVAFVIPNLDNDMHNIPQKCIPQSSQKCFEESIMAGDSWLKKNIDPYYQWAKDNNSLLILTFDENHNQKSYRGLTNPCLNATSSKLKTLMFCNYNSCDIDPEYRIGLENRIVTIFAGAHIKQGDYHEGIGITHVNILRTIEAMYGLPKAGAQQPNAAGIGITDDYIITDVF